MARCSRHQSYQAGHLIIRQSDPIDGWTVVREGIVRLFISDAEGHEHTVRFAHAGDLIGGCPAAFLDQPHGNCYSAEAISNPTEVCHFPRGAQVALFTECPDLAQVFMDLLLAHLADSYHRLHQITTTTVDQRLADVLVRLGQEHPAGGSAPVAARDDGAVTLRIARQQLADILGVAKETAVRALTALKQQGLLETKGQLIQISDIEALRRLVDKG